MVEDFSISLVRSIYIKPIGQNLWDTLYICIYNCACVRAYIHMHVQIVYSTRTHIYRHTIILFFIYVYVYTNIDFY